MIKYLTVLVLIFSGLFCNLFAVDYVVKDGSADLTITPPDNDPSVVGYLVYVKEKWWKGYDLYKDIKSPVPEIVSFPYTERRTIWVKVYTYNAVNMPSLNYVGGSVKLTSSDPPKKVDIK